MQHHQLPSGFGEAKPVAMAPPLSRNDNYNAGDDNEELGLLLMPPSDVEIGVSSATETSRRCNPGGWSRCTVVIACIISFAAGAALQHAPVVSYLAAVAAPVQVTETMAPAAQLVCALTLRSDRRYATPGTFFPSQYTGRILPDLDLPLCPRGHAHTHWITPCENCYTVRNCDISKAYRGADNCRMRRWVEDAEFTRSTGSMSSLGTCGGAKTIIALGDSTLREPLARMLGPIGAESVGHAFHDNGHGYINFEGPQGNGDSMANLSLFFSYTNRYEHTCIEESNTRRVSHCTTHKRRVGKGNCAADYFSAWWNWSGRVLYDPYKRSAASLCSATRSMPVV